MPPLRDMNINAKDKKVERRRNILDATESSFLAPPSSLPNRQNQEMEGDMHVYTNNARDIILRAQ